MQLLGFIYDYTIRDFFCELITNPRHSKTQKMLNNMEFVSIVISDIKQIDIPSLSKQNDQYTNKDICKLRNLYQLISFFPRSKHLSKTFSIQKNFTFLFDRMELLPAIVEQARWDALLAFYDKSTSKFYNPFLSQVIYFISEPYESITIARVSALSLMTKILENDNKYGQVLKDTDFCQVILRLFAQFSDNTFLHNQIYQFISVSLNIKGLREYTISSFVQPLMGFMNEPQKNALKTNTINLLYLFYQQVKKTKSLGDSIHDKKEFEDCIANIIEPHFMTIASPYGRF